MHCVHQKINNISYKFKYIFIILGTNHP